MNWCDYEPVININPYTGHCYKLCPFSDAFYNGWGVDTGVVVSGTESSRGNSHKFPYGGRTNTTPETTYDYEEYGTAVKATHPTTEGKMVVKSRGGGAPGWMCMDDNCPHYVQTGTRYLEV